MKRPIEVLVAEHVLGWEVCDAAHTCSGCDADVVFTDSGTWDLNEIRLGIDGFLVDHLRSPAGWWGVVEAMKDDHDFTLKVKTKGRAIGAQHIAVFEGAGDGYAGNSDLDLHTAIFLAALRAVGVPEEEIQAALRVSEGEG